MPSLAGFKRSFAAWMVSLHLRRGDALKARAEAHYDRAAEWRVHSEAA